MLVSGHLLSLWDGGCRHELLARLDAKGRSTLKWFVLVSLLIILCWSEPLHLVPSSEPSSSSGGSVGYEEYLPVPPVLPDDGPRSGYPRGLPRLGAGEDVAHIEAIEIDGAECPVEVLNAVSEAATLEDLPLSKLSRLAGIECTFDPAAVRYEDNGGVSTGLFQLHSMGLGHSHDPEKLKEPSYNSRIAARDIRRRLDERPHDKERDRWWNALDFWREARKVMLEGEN